MTYVKKVFRKIRQGALKDIMEQTRWIYSYARQYRRQILGYILLGLLSTALGLGAGLISRRLINLVVAGSAGTLGRNVAMVAGGYVLLGLGRVLVSGISNRVSAHVNLNVNREIRGDIYSRFMNTSWQSISQYHTGDLLLRLDRDVSTVASSVLGWIPSLVTALVQFFGALLVILWFDPPMALFALLGVPVSTALMGMLAPKLQSYGLKVQEASGRLNSFYTDSLQNIQSVKAFGLVDSFGDKLYDLQEQHLKVSLQHNGISVGASMLMGLAGMAASYLCLGWGVYRLWTGRIDFGTMVLFIQLAGYLSSAATSLIKLGPGVINATVSAKRLMTILNLPKESVKRIPEQDALAQCPGGLKLVLHQVSFGYRDDQPVLRQVEFTAQPGSVTAVVGPSGSGKTTLLRLMLCLVTPDAGSAVLQGENITVMLQPGLRELFSYVPQQKALFSGTVEETLRLANPQAEDEALWQVLRMVELEDVVKKMPSGLYSSIGEDGGNLSQGQGQRLSIARALLRDAPILLLDEATSALDVATERRILRNIMEQKKDKTVIVTTHRPTVLAMCQCVYEIRNGNCCKLDETEIAERLKEF